MFLNMFNHFAVAGWNYDTAVDVDDTKAIEQFVKDYADHDWFIQELSREEELNNEQVCKKKPSELRRTYADMHGWRELIENYSEVDSFVTLIRGDDLANELESIEDSYKRAVASW